MLIITFLIVFGLFSFEIARKNRLPIDAFRFTMVFYVMLYFVIPEFLPLSYDCAPFCDGIPWMVSVVAFIGLAAMISGYYLSYGLPIFKVSPKVKVNERTEYRFLLIALCISFGALYVYAHGYGGFRDAFSYAAVARITGTGLSETQHGVLARYFVGISYIVFAICLYKLYQNLRNKMIYFVILTGSIVIVLSYGLILGGRGALFQLIMISLFIHLNLRGFNLNLKRITVLILILIIGTWFVAYGKKGVLAASSIFRGQSFIEAFSSIESREIDYIYGRLISEFAHPIKSLGVVMESDVDYNLMKHFWVAPLHLIPTRLICFTGDKPYRITEVNTELLTGSQDGGIPPGLVGSFWYGGGVFGVIVGCIFFGGSIGWMQRQCYGIVRAYPSAIPIVLYIFYKIPWFLSNGDLSVFLKHQFHLFIYLLILLIFTIVRRIRIPRLETIGSYPTEG